MIERVPFTELLSKIIDNRGRTCPTADYGLPLIATNCVKNSTLYPVFEKVRYVNDQTYKTWFRGHPEPGDLIFVCKGAPGQVCLVPGPVTFCIAQDMVALRADPARVYPPYLFAALRSKEVQFDIGNMHVGTLIPHFKKGDFDKLSIPVPPSDQQRLIGDWHLAMEQKIELNRRINETLEAMAQAIFRDWFVDFGPVRRKLASETDPVAIMGDFTSDPTHAAELAALFPADLNVDGLPGEWSMTTLETYAHLNPESWNARSAPASVQYVDLSNTKWGDIESIAPFSWSEAPSRARRVARRGDTLVGTVRPGNGSYAYVGTDGLTASTGFAQLRPKAAHLANLVYIAATNRDNIQRLSLLADGGAYPAVNPSVVFETSIPMIPADLTVAFAKFASPIRAMIEQRKAENRTLAETRDYLLPRLMSGAVRMDDIAATVA